MITDPLWYVAAGVVLALAVVAGGASACVIWQAGAMAGYWPQALADVDPADAWARRMLHIALRQGVADELGLEVLRPGIWGGSWAWRAHDGDWQSLDGDAAARAFLVGHYRGWLADQQPRAVVL